MKVLLATPYLSANWFDSGLFWAAALSRQGHLVRLWDYRLEPRPLTSDIDFMLILKGPVEPLPHCVNVCYWPDAVERTPGIENVLKAYNSVYTCLRPTPNDMQWEPTGWDPLIHKPTVNEKSIESVFIGTGTERKWQFLQAMRPMAIFGNNWHQFRPGGFLLPVYCHEMVAMFSSAKVSINIHQDPIGLNRRFFESMACTFTITDLVPGVEEVLGKELAALVGFKSPEEGRERLEYFKSHDKEREELWQAERKAIEPFTYEEAVERILRVEAP